MFRPRRAAQATKPAKQAQPPAADAETPEEKPRNLADYTYTPDEVIELFELRVNAYPKDHVSFATLGDLYESRGRETDDLAWFARAETALRRSIELFPKYVRAKVSLAVVLCDRHKFAEALEIAQEVHKANPGNIDALATVGDAQLELGRYAEAEQSLRALVQRLPDSAPALARLAHLEELMGQTDEALELDRRAMEILAEGGGRCPDALAWYQFREADLLFNAGRVDEAGKVAEAILVCRPRPSRRDRQPRPGAAPLRDVRARRLRSTRRPWRSPPTRPC